MKSLTELWAWLRRLPSAIKVGAAVIVAAVVGVAVRLFIPSRGIDGGATTGPPAPSITPEQAQDQRDALAAELDRRTEEIHKKAEALRDRIRRGRK